MRLCLTMPNSMKVKAMNQPWESDMTVAQSVAAVKLIEELGFYKVMMGEHFVLPQYHYDLSGDFYFHVPVALSFLAGHTSTIKLGSSVTILPLQNPMIQAKAWSTLDHLSGGRTVPMFGVGWLKEEYDMLGQDFHQRGKMGDEYITIMKKLWAEDVVNYEGEYFTLKDAIFAPKPVQTPMPVWFGGDAEAVLRRVAKFGNGWSPFRTPPEKFPDCVDYLKSQPGYDGREIEMFFSLEMLNVGAHHEVLDDPRAPGGWDVQKIVDQCGWLSKLGVTETIVPTPTLSGVDAYMDRLRWVASEILPKVKDL